MENQQHNQFDQMLRQSLEGAKLPVPSGVWESVGSSLASKAVVATKVASVKLVIIKSIAGLLLTGGMVWGAYELFTNSNTVPSANNTPQNNTVSSIAPAEPNLSVEPSAENVQPTSQNTKVYNAPVSYDSMFETTQVVSIPAKDTVKQPIQTSPSVSASEKTNGERKITKSSTNETPVNETNRQQTTEPTVTPTPEPINLTIPNVFTPYEMDGYNDCFKISIENELKYSIQIFDLNGNKVFESLNKMDCWDGKNIRTGQMCPRGFYTYKLIYELKTGFKKTERGELNLL